MIRSDSLIRITPSILDRLLDYEPDVVIEAASSRTKSLRELKQSVQRDLEFLLNTRRVFETPETLEESLNSVLNFGLPDFTGTSVNNPSEQKWLVKSLTAALKFHEPRLKDVKITLEPISNIERVLRFRIEARLRVEPTPEPVAFDTVLQLGSGVFEVKEK